jgi:hypothetical protein
VQGVTVLETSAVVFSLWYEPQVDHPAFEVLASRTSKIQDAMLFWPDQSAWDYHEIARGHSCGRQHQLIVAVL